MHYWQGQARDEQTNIRDLPLLTGEHVIQQFVPNEGLVAEAPSKGQLLVLTNQRVISFVQVNERKQMSLAPLEELKGVSVKGNSRGAKDVLQGPTLIFVGILVYLVVGYSFERVALAGALGAAIAFMGVLLTARLMLWEDEGSIVFQGGYLKLSFPYKTSKAGGDVNKLVTQFFKIKDGTNSHHSDYLQAPESSVPISTYSPPQHERHNDF